VTLHPCLQHGCTAPHCAMGSRCFGTDATAGFARARVRSGAWSAGPPGSRDSQIAVCRISTGLWKTRERERGRPGALHIVLGERHPRSAWTGAIGTSAVPLTGRFAEDRLVPSHSDLCPRFCWYRHAVMISFVLDREYGTKVEVTHLCWAALSPSNPLTQDPEPEILNALSVGQSSSSAASLDGPLFMARG